MTEAGQQIADAIKRHNVAIESSRSVARALADEREAASGKVAVASNAADATVTDN